ncbi:MAG: hypothetical protein E6H10_03040 [Bacteroidetes bacterium]|nr:MAG: hypothetical protein E6H10_03040 [Bacteroidota bacterium]
MISTKKPRFSELQQDDIILAQEQIFDRVILEGKYQYDALITIARTKQNACWVILEFDNLCLADFIRLSELSKLSKAIKIRSDIIDKENYSIKEIVVTNHVEDDLGFIIWECTSQ